MNFEPQQPITYLVAYSLSNHIVDDVPQLRELRQKILVKSQSQAMPQQRTTRIYSLRVDTVLNNQTRLWSAVKYPAYFTHCRIPQQCGIFDLDSLLVQQLVGDYVRLTHCPNCHVPVDCTLDFLEQNVIVDQWLLQKLPTIAYTNSAVCHLEIQNFSLSQQQQDLFVPINNHLNIAELQTDLTQLSVVLDNNPQTEVSLSYANMRAPQKKQSYRAYCLLSGKRINIPFRLVNCFHYECYDLLEVVKMLRQNPQLEIQQIFYQKMISLKSYTLSRCQAKIREENSERSVQCENIINSHIILQHNAIKIDWELKAHLLKIPQFICTVEMEGLHSTCDYMYKPDPVISKITQNLFPNDSKAYQKITDIFLLCQLIFETDFQQHLNTQYEQIYNNIYKKMNELQRYSSKISKIDPLSKEVIEVPVRCRQCASLLSCDLRTMIVVIYVSFVEGYALECPLCKNLFKLQEQTVEVIQNLQQQVPKISLLQQILLDNVIIDTKLCAAFNQYWSETQDFVLYDFKTLQYVQQKYDFEAALAQLAPIGWTHPLYIFDGARKTQDTVRLHCLIGQNLLNKPIRSLKCKPHLSCMSASNYLMQRPAHCPEPSCVVNLIEDELRHDEVMQFVLDKRLPGDGQYVIFDFRSRCIVREDAEMTQLNRHLTEILQSIEQNQLKIKDLENRIQQQRITQVEQLNQKIQESKKGRHFVIKQQQPTQQNDDKELLQKISDNQQHFKGIFKVASVQQHGSTVTNIEEINSQKELNQLQSEQQRLKAEREELALRIEQKRKERAMVQEFQPQTSTIASHFTNSAVNAAQSSIFPRFEIGHGTWPDEQIEKRETYSYAKQLGDQI